MGKMRKLGVGKIAISLISLHYGLGFLLGTGEAVFNIGLAGMTYALSCAFGLLFLSLIAKFYWQKKYPIWTLFEKFYGKNVKEGVCFLSWVWMIGIVASQILGATFILGILGISPVLGMIITITVISFVSLLPIEKLSKFFLFLLILNSIAIIVGTLKITTGENFKNLFISMPKDFSNQSLFSILGIALPTILITIFGMDFHQFIVQAKSAKGAVWGSILGGTGLIIASLLPTMITFSAVSNKILPLNIDGKQAIPFVLLNLVDNKAGFFLVLSLLTVSIASGSALSRILTKTFQDFSFISKKLKSTQIILIINALIIFFLSITGKSIISLIVCFYAIYISGIIIPFTLYFLQSEKILFVPQETVFHSLIVGAVSSTIILISSKAGLLPKILSDSLELLMVSFGLFSSFVIVLSNLVIKFLISKIEPKMRLLNNTFNIVIPCLIRRIGGNLYRFQLEAGMTEVV